MHDVNTIGGIAQRLEYLSDEFRAALASHDDVSASRVSGEALALLSESARLVRNAHEQGKLSVPDKAVGIVWEEATEPWSTWQHTYEPPYENYRHPGFALIDLREGLSKILHAAEMTFRLSNERHELVLAGDKRPFSPPGKRKPWLGVVCVSQLTALMQLHTPLANIRRS